MFCDSCGATFYPGQTYCARCGKAIIGPVTAEAGRVARHNHLLGVLWIAYSVFHVIGGVVLLILVNTLFRVRFIGPGELARPQIPMFIRPLLGFIALLLLVKAAAGMIAGVGLIQRQAWARILALVLAFIALIDVPLGTALGVYSLWVLLAPNADEEYRQMAHAAGA